MAIEVGMIFEGTVTGLAKFGAFVKMPTGETGLCHISEIADDYVKEVSDYLSEGQSVKAKILSVDPRGKISLSIKQAQSSAKSQDNQMHDAQKKSLSPSRPQSDFRRKPPSRPKDFESMLNSFMKTSDEKLRDVKKAAKANRRGNGHGSR